MIILGLNAFHPDAAVAFWGDEGLMWAAEEERFNRSKHYSGFPTMALQAGMKALGLTPAAIDYVAIGKQASAHALRKLIYLLRYRPDFGMLQERVKSISKKLDLGHDMRQALGEDMNLRGKVISVEHHRAHLASSFYVSGYEHAACLSIDGMGDFSSMMMGVAHDLNIKTISQIYFPHSAGFVYTAATQFLGFRHFGDEFKIMGLASYGKPRFLEIFRRMVQFENKGTFKLNLRYFTHHKGHRIRWTQGIPQQDILFSELWEKEIGPRRDTKNPISERDQDIASSVQHLLQEIYVHALTYLHKVTQLPNICLAGGVAFNGVANGQIVDRTPFRDVYIQPAAGDSGIALGAAAFVAHQLKGLAKKFVMHHAAFGNEFNEAEIRDALQEKGLQYRVLSAEELISQTCQKLQDGAVVGWFQGRMEFGPRALGNRSILADPRRSDMMELLNQRIKRRETFRPFAPAVPVEKAAEYFEMNSADSPFMLKVVPVREDKAAVIPAVTHVDRSARVQTVDQTTNPLFWKLLMRFGDATGVYVLLNTSFNENEPIVCKPQEAIDCFLKTKMDVLVLGFHWVMK